MPTQLKDGVRIEITQAEYDALFPPTPEPTREELVAKMVVSRANFAVKAAVAGLVTVQEAEDWAGGTKLPAVITAALAGISDDNERLAARIHALTADTVRRDSPIIAMSQTNLGLSDDQVDALFSEDN